MTIKQVAQEAGVSTQTISRVLNNRPDVASETRQRVLEVIERLGYHPSALARSLIRQRSHTLGVVSAGLKFVGPARTLNGITQQAEAMGYALLLIELPSYESSNARMVIQTLLSRHVDGILWAAPEVGENRKWLEGSPIEIPTPTVFLTMAPKTGAAVLAIDNYAGGLLAMEHLLEGGYRRIGHVSGPLEWWEARQRKAAWQDALAQAGLTVSEDQHVHALRSAEGNWSSASGQRAFLQLIESYPELEAVFVANDQMALGVIQAAYDRGLRIPHDLAVVGFDGIPESGYYWPPLTTVFQDQNQLGCLAVNRLVEMIEIPIQDRGDLASLSITLQPQLVIRASSRKAQEI